LPDIVREFDLAGTVVGTVEKGKVITGNEIKAGDVIVGLESSGIHSNGYSLARKVLDTNDLRHSKRCLSYHDICHACA